MCQLPVSRIDESFLPDRIFRLLATLIFANWSAIWLVAGFAALACGLTVWAYWRSGLPRRDQWLAAGLRLLAVFTVAFCLLEPLWSRPQAKPGSNLFLVLADNSQSLQIQDTGQSTSRGEALRNRLDADKNRWLGRLQQDFEVRQYHFEAALQVLPSPEVLKFEGQSSQIRRALQEVATRFQNRPVAGVLLMTDGLSTDDLADLQDQAGLPPIYPVVFGSPTGHVDVGLSHLSVTTTAFEDAPATITASVSQVGASGETVQVELVDGEQKVIERQTVTLPANDQPASVQFRFRPTKPGLSFYQLKLVPDNRLQQRESTAQNNTRQIVIDRGAGPYRVLYVSGRPNWEYKFLKRAIADDEQLQMTAMIRVAKKEPKFDWRSRSGESTNPFFRGFDQVGESTERFDQPVIVRLETKTPEEFRDGFPKKAEELFPFHAVILDDLESEFFTTDQMVLLEKFVAERGGACLMLGGLESFAEGNYGTTPIGRLLPVYLNGPPTTITPQGWKWSLTREGLLQPWARLSAKEEEERAREKGWPSFQTLNFTGAHKPGALAIAEVTNTTQQKLPALVVQRFGAGRTGALLVGDLWRLPMQQPLDRETADDPGKLWRQFLRWLIVDVPNRIEVRPVEQNDGSLLQRLEIRLRNAEFAPQDNAAVTVTLTQPDGSTVQQAAEPSLTEPGFYEVLAPMRTPGAYRVQVEGKDPDGRLIGTAEAGWVSDPLAEEFRQVAPDRAAMAQLAERTGGELLEPADLERFAEEVRERPAPLVEQVATPAWQHPLVLLLIAGCLCGEWGVRRWRGMA